jgi:hypothetical protein
MPRGAQTPEELETLFEDAFVTRDHVALADLFEDGGVLLAEERQEARGDDIGLLAAALWDGCSTYVADPARVVQARDHGADRRRRCDGRGPTRHGRSVALRHRRAVARSGHHEGG